MVNRDATIAPGRVLNGKWTLGPLLGRGGRGLVFEAAHRNGIRAAVKVLLPAFTPSPDEVARFLREGAVSNQLEHVGAVAALDDDCTEDGVVYVVYERLDGATLAALLDEAGPLPLERAAAIADGLLDVLAAAHEKGIVHRDLTPANVFVLRSGRVKLIDFGLARVDPSSCPELGCPAPTRDGTVMGTPGFIAPEQALGIASRVDARSDLWSVGALLFTMLTGRTVHAGKTPAEALLCAARVPAPPVRSVRPDLAPAVARVIDRALASRPDDRFESAAELRAALGRALRATQAAGAVAAPAAAPRANAAPPLRVGYKERSFAVVSLVVVSTFAVGLLALAWLVR